MWDTRLYYERIEKSKKVLVWYLITGNGTRIILKGRVPMINT